MRDATDVNSDRVRMLRELDAGSLQRLLCRLPVVAAAVADHGPLAHLDQYGYWRDTPHTIDTPEQLARLLSTPMVLMLAIVSASRVEFQLLVLASWHGGRLERGQFELALRSAEAGASRQEPLAAPKVAERAAAGLVDLGLVEDTGGSLVLRPGVRELVPLPGIPLRPSLEYVNSDRVAAMLRALGVRAPSRKTERVDALEAAVRDRDVVVRALDALSRRARSVFERIAAQGETTVPALTNGGYFDPYRPSFGGSRRGNESVDALQALVDLGLVGVDHGSQRCWVWLDVIAALNGHLYADWTPRPEPRPVAIVGAGAASSLPPVLGRFEQLLDHLGAVATPALKTGGFGVRGVRDAAKALGFAVGEVGFLVWLAIELGLVAPVEIAVRGRGRTRKADEAWKLTAAAQEWSVQPAAARWARLVQQWLDSPRLPADEVPERWELQPGRIHDVTARTLFLRTLAEMRPGQGLGAADLTSVLGERHHLLFGESVVTSLLAQSRTLGLVPATGPVGICDLGRTLLASLDELQCAVVADAEQTFVVQPDHTVVAGPTLDPDVQATLARIAELESDAGARVYRITEAQTTRALDYGMSVDEILGFLHAHARAGVSANVERTIRDCAARHGRLQVGAAASFVTTDDAALLARALAVKSAKLTPVNATTAVSALPPAKLLSVLRTRGLAPRGIEDGAGRANAPPPDAVALRHAYEQARPDVLRSQLLLDDASIASLAKRLHDAPRPRTEAKDRRRATACRVRPQLSVPDEEELELLSFEELRALGDVLADPEG